MFGSLGVPEIVLIFVVALILFGPRQMPQIGKSVGKALAEFRRASNEFKRTIEDEVATHDLEEVKEGFQQLGDIGREVASIKDKGLKDLKDLAIDKDASDS